MKLNKELMTLAVVLAVSNVIAAIAGVPQWVLVTITGGVLMLGAFALGRQRLTALPLPTSESQSAEPDPDPWQAPQLSETLRGVRFPSAVPEYHFKLSATVCWVPMSPALAQTDLTSAAVEALTQRARRALADCAPTDEPPVDHLSSVLGYPEVDGRQAVKVWAENVAVSLPGVEANHLRRLAELRRKREIIDRENDLWRAQGRFLKDEVLVTPGSATVWWLARHIDEIEQCVELHPTLRRLSAMANDVPESPAELVSAPGVDRFEDPATAERPACAAAQDELVGVPSAAGMNGDGTAFGVDMEAAVSALLDGHDPSERLFKASSLAQLEENFNRPDRAKMIRDRFDVVPVQASVEPDRQAAEHTDVASAPSHDTGAEPLESSTEDVVSATAVGPISAPSTVPAVNPVDQPQTSALTESKSSARPVLPAENTGGGLPAIQVSVTERARSDGSEVADDDDPTPASERQKYREFFPD